MTDWEKEFDKTMEESKEKFLKENTVIQTNCDCVIYLVARHRHYLSNGDSPVEITIGYTKLCDLHKNDSINRYFDRIKDEIKTGGKVEL